LLPAERGRTNRAVEQLDPRKLTFVCGRTFEKKREKKKKNEGETVACLSFFSFLRKKSNVHEKFTFL